jgi:hypothetical protein
MLQYFNYIFLTIISLKKVMLQLKVEWNADDTDDADSR